MTFGGFLVQHQKSCYVFMSLFSRRNEMQSRGTKEQWKKTRCARVVESVWAAVKHTMVEVEAVGTIGYTCIGALAEVETTPACGALVAAAPNAGLAQRGALLAAFPIITEKATGTLRDTHPGERGN